MSLSLRRRLSIAALGMALAILPTLGMARPLAVPGRTPKKALAVISVTEPGDLWKGFSASPMYQPAQKLFERAFFGDGADLNAFDKQRADIEDAVGYSLTAPAIFQDGVRGFDFYVTASNEQGKPPYTVMVVNFQDEEQARKTLELLVKEGKAASGVANGERAETLSESKDGDQVVYSFRGLKTHLASVGSVLIISSEDEGAWAVLDGKATTALFDTDAYRRSVGTLDPLPGQMWAFGDVTELMGLAYSIGLIPTEASVDLSVSRKIGLLFEFQPEHLKVTQYVANTEMTGVERAIAAATRPDTTGFKAAGFLPAETMLLTTSNNFEGPSLFTAMREQLVKSAPGQFSEADLTKGLATADSMVGFSIENDFIGSLGSETAFGVTDLNIGTPDASGIPSFSGDFLFASSLADAARMDVVMRQFEVELNKQAAMFLPPAEADGKTPPAPPSLFEETTHNETVVHTLDLAKMTPIAAGIAPSYGLTSDGFMVFALKKETVLAALDRKKSGGGDVFKSSTMINADRLLSPNRNEMQILNFNSTVNVIQSITGLIPASEVSSTQRTMLPLVMDLLRSAGTLYTAGTYTTEGVTKEYVFLMR
jgi:hypothetical protein